MTIKRLAAHAPRTRAVANDLAELSSPCIGCKGCEGLCLALIEAMTLPEAILSKGRGA